MLLTFSLFQKHDGGSGNMVNCINCSTENLVTSNYCKNCGKSLNQYETKNQDSALEQTNLQIAVSFYESMPGRVSLGNNSSYIKGILELDENEIIVHKKSFWRGKDRGTKHIRYDNITSVDYDAGKFLALPSIQVYLSSVEYSFRSDDKRLKELYEIIRQKIDESHNKSELKISPLDELKKLAELKDMGVVTQEEFELKKKELLGL